MNIQLISIIGMMMLCFACDIGTSEQPVSQSVLGVSNNELRVANTPPKIKIDTSDYHIYTWKKGSAPQNALINRIAPPVGYQREKVRKNSFADWLRHLPLKPDGTRVHYFNGTIKPNQNVHAAVIDIDTGTRDLQQCADAVMRLKAEYHYGLKQYEQIHFNYTSGDVVSFDDWQHGRKPTVSGSRVNFTSRTENTDNSYRNFKRYMRAIFNYAGTYSLSKEMQNIAINEMQTGDVFIQGGFPGHAVIVVDTAVYPTTGERLFLLAQSYMPAQDMHLLINPNDRSLSPWYSLDFQGDLNTPEWTFTRGDLRRFK